MLYYLLSINIIAFFATVIDKNNAKKGKWRISENTLLTIALLGGSITMFFVMRIIRHKTLHNKFMIGLPIIIVLQCAVLFYFLSKYF